MSQLPLQPDMSTLLHRTADGDTHTMQCGRRTVKAHNILVGLHERRAVLLVGGRLCRRQHRTCTLEWCSTSGTTR